VACNGVTIPDYVKIRHLIQELNGNIHGINLSMTWLVEWFMKHVSIIWREKDKIWNKNRYYAVWPKSAGNSLVT